MEKVEVVVVGAGLGGLSCAFELARAGHEVLLLEEKAYPGGRTASWDQDGMPVESGLHRFRGIYRALPALLARAGLNVQEIVNWQTRVELRPPTGDPAFIGLAPRYDPAGALRTVFGNRRLFSWRDKLSLIPLLAAGVASHSSRPGALDERDILSYALERGLTPRCVELFLLPLTHGVFFKPPEHYSAHAFMMPLAFSLRRLHRMRTGVFRGGMTDVMARPLVSAFEANGGRARMNAPVVSLRWDGRRVSGVELANDSIAAKEVVIATPLGAAKRLLRPMRGALESLFRLPSLPAVTLQLDLRKPALPHDMPVFAPGTPLIAFAEQSRTTFQGRVGGRLSAVLANPETLIRLSDDQILQRAVEAAEGIGLDIGSDIERSFLYRLASDFADAGPGSDSLRPPQATTIKALTLAGDYTRQPFLSTMEGAVISGQLAARAVRAALRG